MPKEPPISEHAIRLRTLHAKMQCTWAALAQRIGVSESMIYQVLKGASGFSEKALFRLEQWEKEFMCESNVRPAPPLKNVRRVPVVSYAMAGKAADYDDLANFLDETIETDCKDANCFALIVEGDSMEPAIRAGDRVVVMPNSEAQSGDIVVARRRDTHEVFVKLVHFNDSNRRVKFTSYNPAYPALEFARKDFRFIYPVHSMQRVFRRSENGHTGKG
ncbi:MAG: LexA family transcriptional regulator [Verrucomicrobia bacterium]|nr:LexA family transcriptional regulator [Verrucomicrobiota bacterium]